MRSIKIFSIEVNLPPNFLPNFSGRLSQPGVLNKDLTVWLDVVDLPTSGSHPSSWEMHLCSCVVKPPPTVYLQVLKLLVNLTKSFFLIKEIRESIWQNYFGQQRTCRMCYLTFLPVKCSKVTWRVDLPSIYSTVLSTVKCRSTSPNHHLRSIKWTWILIGFPSFCQIHCEFLCLSNIRQMRVESSPGLTCRSSGSRSNDCRQNVAATSVVRMNAFW